MTKEAKNNLSEREKTVRDIATLNESIRLNWLDLAREGGLQLSAEEQAGIRKNTEMLMDSLKELLQLCAAVR
jgi:hypothetical protein